MTPCKSDNSCKTDARAFLTPTQVTEGALEKYIDADYLAEHIKNIYWSGILSTQRFGSCWISSCQRWILLQRDSIVAK